ncbi:MAG: hypothetical protein Unbinned4098contig1000_3 [Prokaryotic dsDNA virus sp.]|nr:MAG: hypothetical protein Unbinned4098contig1000_3 [Prokaryotic dsDNA virus sp.]|tara:strand:+ start:8529 stop:9428 length:900 start_codon:yes stop_codon:yes gene_type:complete
MTTKNKTVTYEGKSSTGKRVAGTHLTLSQLGNISRADVTAENKATARYYWERRLANRKFDSWYGTLQGKTIDDARKYVTEGWREGADKALSFVSDIYAKCTLPEPKDVRRKQVWSDDGDELDYDKLMGGELDTMYRTTKREGKGQTPHCSLIVNWGGLAYVEADDLFWSGAVAIILSDVLENAGYRVEIVGCNTSQQDGGVYSATSVAVKELDEPLRTDIVAGALCEAGVFRTLGFAAKMTANTAIDRGMGCTDDFTKVAVNSVKGNPFSEDSFVIKQCLSMEDAIAEINRVCEELDSK